MRILKNIVVITLLLLIPLSAYGSINSEKEYNDIFVKHVDIWDSSSVEKDLEIVKKDINYLKRLTYDTAVVVEYMDIYMMQLDKNNNIIKKGLKEMIKIEMLIIAIALLLFIGAVGTISYRAYGTVVHLQHIEVVKTERIRKAGKDKYLIFTGGETFENSDTIFYLKFNSSDIYGQLNNGFKYNLKVNGWRIPFLSMYRNILKIEPIY